MNNGVGKGAVVLVVSGLICKLFGGLFRLPLTNIVGIEGIAVYQMVMSIYSLALVFVSGGVTNSLSRLVSGARAKGDKGAIGAYFRNALLFSLSLSALFAVIFLLFSYQISSLQGASEGSASYKLLAILLPLGGIVGVSRGLLQGYGNMTPTAVSQIIEQIVKFGFGLIFAYLFKSQGIAGGVFGAVLGITISEVFACLYLGLIIAKKERVKTYQSYKREFYKATLPLTFGGVVLPLTHAIESLFIVKLLLRSGLSESAATSIYGIQTGVVSAILNFPLIISLAVASSLLPNLSFLAEKGEKEKQTQLIAKSMHTMWFLLIPIVGGLMAVSGRLYSFVYPAAMMGYEQIAVQLTFVSGISTICTALMQQLVSILQANGYFKHSLIFYSIGGISKLAILFIVAPIPGVSVFAIAISSIVLSCTVSICVIIKLGNLIKLSLFDILLPILSTTVVYMVAKIILSLIGGFAGLALAIIVGVSVYFALAFPLTSKYISFFTDKLKKRAE